mmetsp:Transcript_34212/g.79565  ORF Transcript_34212/g.79565 Transcript_34212/m.79565 type:complete len:166 (-) Transcript_34212:67-564(-)
MPTPRDLAVLHISTDFLLALLLIGVGASVNSGMWQDVKWVEEFASAACVVFLFIVTDISCLFCKGRKHLLCLGVMQVVGWIYTSFWLFAAGLLLLFSQQPCPIVQHSLCIPGDGTRRIAASTRAAVGFAFMLCQALTRFASAFFSLKAAHGSLQLPLSARSKLAR